MGFQSFPNLWNEVLVSLVDYYYTVFLFNCSYELKKGSNFRIPGHFIYICQCALKKEVYNNSCYSYSIIVALWEIKLKLRIYLTFRMIRHTCSALMFCIVRDYEKGLSRFNKTSMLKMYVGTYKTSSKVNFVFQHAFYCHVYHRSLRFISYKFQSS